MSKDKEFYFKEQTYITLANDIGWFDWLFYNDRKPVDDSKVIFELVALGLIRYFLDKNNIVPKTYITKDQKGNLGIASRDDQIREDPNSKAKQIKKAKFEEEQKSEELQHTRQERGLESEQLLSNLAHLDVVGCLTGDFDTLGECLQNLYVNEKTYSIYKFDASEAISSLRRPLIWKLFNLKSLKIEINLKIMKLNTIYIKVPIFLKNTFFEDLALKLQSVVNSRIPNKSIKVLFFSGITISYPLIVLPLRGAIHFSKQAFYNFPINYFYPKIKSIFTSLNEKDYQRLNKYYTYYFGPEAISNKIEDGKSIFEEVNNIAINSKVEGKPLQSTYQTYITAKYLKQSLDKLFQLDDLTLFLIINKIPDEVFKPSLKAEVFDLLAERRNLIFRKLGRQVEGYNLEEVKIKHPYLYSNISFFTRSWHNFKKNFGIYTQHNYHNLLEEYNNDPKNFTEKTHQNSLLEKYLNQKKILRAKDSFHIKEDVHSNAGQSAATIGRKAKYASEASKKIDYTLGL